MAEIRYVISLSPGLFVGIDGESAADGYRYGPASSALRFTSQEDCAIFMTQTGPTWLLKMVQDDLFRIVRLVDGVPS